MAKGAGRQSGKKPAARMALRATEQIALPRNGRKAVRDDLPVDARAFPDSALLNPAALEKDLGQLFGTLGDLRERNPFGNSVKLLALELGKRLDAGKLSYGDIERLIQQLSAEAYAHRAERLAAYVGERDEAKNEAAIRAAVRRVAVPDEARGKKPSPRPFAEFQALLERELFGIVMTAHPQVGDTHRQEYLKGEAEDQYWLVDLAQRVRTPFVTTSHAVLTLEWTRLEPGVIDRKYFVRGIGLVAELSAQGPRETARLVHHTTG